MTQKARDKITKSSPQPKRINVEEWAYWHFSDACANLHIKHRFGIIAAIDLLSVLAHHEPLKRIAESQNHSLLEAVEQGLQCYVEKHKGANSAKLKGEKRTLSGGIGSCLSLTEPPPKVQK